MLGRIRYHLDENVNLAIAQGLRRAGIDVTTSRDVGLLGKSDLEHLLFAKSQKRILLTHDDDLLLLDTLFIQALLNSKDRHHQQARVLLPRVYNAREVWVTEAVLVEVGNAFSAMNRSAASQSIQQCYRTPNITVVTVDTVLLGRALQLYGARPDKDWGLTDCISFTLMSKNNLIEAATADFHFVQAGYRAFLLEVV